MWLTTPRFLLGVVVAAVAAMIVGFAQARGAVGPDAARLVWGILCLALMAAIIIRARARWKRWSSRP